MLSTSSEFGEAIPLEIKKSRSRCMNVGVCFRAKHPLLGSGDENCPLVAFSSSIIILGYLTSGKTVLTQDTWETIPLWTAAEAHMMHPKVPQRAENLCGQGLWTKPCDQISGASVQLLLLSWLNGAIYFSMSEQILWKRSSFPRRTHYFESQKKEFLNLWSFESYYYLDVLVLSVSYWMPPYNFAPLTLSSSNRIVLIFFPEVPLYS